MQRTRALRASMRRTLNCVAASVGRVLACAGISREMRKKRLNSCMQRTRALRASMRRTLNCVTASVGRVLACAEIAIDASEIFRKLFLFKDIRENMFTG